MSTSSNYPLCVDLDGTLIHSDITFETLILYIKKYPWKFFLPLFWIIRGRAYLKKKLSDHVIPRIDLLPYHKDFFQFLKQEHKKGRKLILITASDIRIANKIEKYLGIFEDVFGSNGIINLRGKNKSAFLVKKYGKNKFDYAGNSTHDIAVWENARNAIAINASNKILLLLKKNNKLYKNFKYSKNYILEQISAIRLHQWVKNTLLFFPLFASHQIFNTFLLFKTTVAFFSFCFISSSVYIMNDLLDLESDRQHNEKQYRPFAQGSLSIPLGFSLSAILFIASFLLGALISIKFLLIILLYLFITTVYSFRLKTFAIIDVLTLSLLYILRIIAGYICTGLTYSNWLFTFSMFIFLSLAFLKRYVETKQTESSKIQGRGYKQEDAQQLKSFGITSGYLSILIFILYIDSNAVKKLYASPSLLWLLIPIFIYEISILWLKADQGKIKSDPIVSLLKDKNYYIILMISSLIILLAKFY